MPFISYQLISTSSKALVECVGNGCFVDVEACFEQGLQRFFGRGQNQHL